MIKLKKLINESNVWDRKFGEPLPTLKNAVEQHNKSTNPIEELTAHDCDCSGDCCEVNESVADKAKATKQLQKIMNSEGKLRKLMYDLSDRLDSDPLNQKLSKKLKESYKNNVTKFMRDVVSVVKDMK